MSLVQYPNARGFIGVGVEATPGVAASATSWLPLLGDTLERAPGVVAQKLIRATRAASSSPVVAEQKVTGSIDVPLYVDQGIAFLAQAIGADVYQYSGAAGTAVAIGGSGVDAGSTTISLATQTSPALAAGDFVQLYQTSSATPGVTNLTELHKVASVSGSGPYTLTLAPGEGVVNAYSATGRVARVPASTVVFSHALVPDQPNAGAYKTLTLEKNRAGMDSRQYTGAVVDKAALSLVSKQAATISYDVVAIGDGTVTASTPSYGTSAPLALPNFGVSLFGVDDTSVVSFDLQIANGVKPYWTFSGQSLPSVAPPTVREVTGRWTNLVQSGQYYTNANAGTTGPMVLTLAQGANSIAITLPLGIITRLRQPLKLGELFQYQAELAAMVDPASGVDVSAVVVNGSWLPFV